MRFDLTDLRLFLLVLETGSITHGAAQANMSLPSASARLRGMEEIIGLPLLERSRRGVEPTPAGDTLAHHAKLVLNQIEQMQGELGEYSKGLEAHIRLWANTAAITEFLPKGLAPFLAGRPNIIVNLKERRSVEIVKAVSSGVAEIGIISSAVDHGTLQTFPFATDRLVLIVPRGNALAEQRRIAFREVVGHPFVGLSAGNPFQELLCEQAALAGRPFSLRVRMRTFEDVCHMVEHGVGFGIVPQTVVKKFRGRLGIHSIGLTDGWATRNLALCVRQFDTLPRYARDLVKHLSTCVQPASVKR
jgi:molybdate transport repressor ModE-like protein